jgi:diguanylate cyclase (GGDEF)-like protein/PAS domain S-box-containing protein
MRMDEALFNAVLDTVTDGVYIVDLERRIRHWSRGAEVITGFTPQQVIGTTCGETMLCHLSPDGRILCTAGCPLDATLKSGQGRTGHVYLRHRDGHRFPVFAHSTPLFDASGVLAGAAEVFHEETTELAAAERIRQLRQVALLDPLTRLGNRRYTRMMLSSRLDELRRYGWPFGLLFIDIDHFKNVNDTHGHELGDKALRVVATTLLKSLRPFDFLGRWAGDEFLALIVNVSRHELATVAERARMLVESSLVESAGRGVRLTVSIGAVTARAQDTVDQLVARADALMYESKLAGRNQVRAEPVAQPGPAPGVGPS